jgi:hypothetical protein
VVSLTLLYNGGSCPGSWPHPWSIRTASAPGDAVGGVGQGVGEDPRFDLRAHAVGGAARPAPRLDEGLDPTDLEGAADLIDRTCRSTSRRPDRCPARGAAARRSRRSPARSRTQASPADQPVQQRRQLQLLPQPLQGPRRYVISLLLHLSGRRQDHLTQRLLQQILGRMERLAWHPTWSGAAYRERGQ